MTDEALNAEAAPDVQPEVQEEAPQRTTRDAVRDALARAQEARPREAFERAPEELQEAPEEAPEAKGPERGPDGKFKAKDGEAKPEAEAPEETTKEDDEPPARFSPDAKQAWKDAPAPVKAEIRRALAENEKGLTEYQKRWEPLKRFDEMARQSGTTLHEAMEKYTGLENLMRQDPVRGLDAVARNAGVSLVDVARHILGDQQPQGEADPRDARIAQLEQVIGQLQQQIGGVTQNVQRQQYQTLQERIDAAKGDMPRYDELEPRMVQLIKSGIAEGATEQEMLLDAYQKADRMNPAASPAQPAPQSAPAPQPAFEEPAARAQTPQPLSVQGAPASGSNPAASRKPSPNARSSVKRALAMALRG